MSWKLGRSAVQLFAALTLTLGLAQAAELNPAAVTYKLPDQID